jgi:hypothetical protein
LRERAEAIDSLTPEDREVVLLSELINDECLHGVVILNGEGFPVNAKGMGIKPKGRLLLQQLEKEEFVTSVIQKHREAFKSLDRRQLSRMDDPAFAKWQSEYKQDEPEWRLGEHEWQRRITATQIRAGRWATAFALIGVVVGGFTQSFLSSHRPFDERRNPPNVQTKTKVNGQTQQQRPASAPIQATPQPLPLLPIAPGQTNPPSKP